MYNRLAVRLFVCIAILQLTSLDLRAAEAGFDYDQLAARGIELLVNGSFEQTNREGEMPSDVGVPASSQDRFQLVTDAANSKHGARFVTFRPDGVKSIYARLKSVPAGKCRATVWTRGEGRMAMSAGVIGQGWRTRPASERFLVRTSSDRFAIESEEWSEHAWEFTLPESYESDGEGRKAESVSFIFATSGDISLDCCSVVSLTELNAQLDRLETPPIDSVAALDLRPMLTIPRFDSPPTIDGNLADGQWSRAAAVTGFTTPGLQKLDRQHTVVLAGYDQRQLYLAFRCPHNGPIQQIPADRVLDDDHRNQVVEIWLQPPGESWSRVAVNSDGSVLDADQTAGPAYSADWTHGERVSDVAEEIGGILSFQKKLWTVEIAIPFDDLSGALPQDGETWRVNFVRKYGVAEGSVRGPDDIASWSPLDESLDEVSRFGSAVFGPDSPAIQLLEFGDLPAGGLTLAGTRRGGSGRVLISARAAFRDDRKTVSFTSVNVPESTDGEPFLLSDTLKVNTAAELVYRVTAEDSLTGRRLAAGSIPFTAAAGLRVKLIPIIAAERLSVNIDVGHATRPSGEAVVTATLFRGDTPTGRSASAVWESGTPSGDLSMSLAGLPPGDYSVKASLGARGDSALGLSSTAGFVVPPRPEWFDDSIGTSTEVPAPWQPVRTTGNRVSITQREYTVGPLGLPQQIEVLGQQILSATAGLPVVVDGSPLAWKCEPLEPVASSDESHAWRVRATAGPLFLSGTLTVEFDGFALWDFSLSADRPTVVDTLAIEFPFEDSRSLYARGKDATLDDRGSFAAMLNGPPGAEDLTIAGGHFSAGGWIWPKQWCHEVWIGDDERGLSVMCETQENLTGDTRTEVARSAGSNTLTIHLIGKPTALSDTLHYRYAWQATPVKPRPENPKLWHAAYRRKGADDAIRELAGPSPLGVTLDMWGLKFTSHPEYFRNKRQFELSNDWLKERGTKVVPYFGTNMVTTEAPDLEPLRAEWEAYPTRIGTNPRGGWYIGCPKSRSFVDYLLYSERKILDQLGYDGLYLDVSNCSGCMNHYHGCGYRDSDTGQWHQTVPVLANRELYKRLYKLNKSDGRDAWLFRHGMPVAAVAGFVDVVTQGEDWCREQDHQYDRLTPEIFRAREARIQYGTPYTWYSFHHYYRGEKFGGRVPLSAILAYCLPHRVLPTVGHTGIWPVWSAVDRFWTDSEYLPHWSAASPVKIDAPGVLATVYLRKQPVEALLVVANWSRETKSVEVMIDVEKLGLSHSRLQIARALKHPILQPEDSPETDLMSNTPLEYRNGRLPLTIDRRNLEVILLTEK